MNGIAKIVFLRIPTQLMICDLECEGWTAFEPKILSASTSFTSHAAFLLTNDIAFFVWWSSETFGEGTKIQGFLTKQSSEIDKAPALALLKSLWGESCSDWSPVYECTVVI